MKIIVVLVLLKRNKIEVSTLQPQQRVKNLLLVRKVMKVQKLLRKHLSRFKKQMVKSQHQNQQQMKTNVKVQTVKALSVMNNLRLNPRIQLQELTLREERFVFLFIIFIPLPECFLLLALINRMLFRPISLLKNLRQFSE